MAKTKLSEVRLSGEIHLSHMEQKEREDAKAGALPAGVEVPKFDGDILKYQSWWERFRALVHENKRVSRFWKMQYLRQAMIGNAAALFSGREGTEEGYDDAIVRVQQRYGKEHLVIRHTVMAALATPPPASEEKAFGD